MKKLLTLLFVSLVCFQTFAIPADSKPVTTTQPNGEEITIIMKGDEYIHWAETLDGYTLLSNSDFYFYYAQLNASGDLEQSQYIATEIHNRPQEVSAWLQTISKNLFFSESQVDIFMQLRAINEMELEKSRSGTIGLNKLPVILMEFPDRPARKTVEDFNLVFNQINYYENGFKGSMKDFFLESSYNKLEVHCYVYGPYMTSQDAAFYAFETPSGYNPNYPTFAREAITAAYNDGVNFSEFAVNGNQIEGVYCIYAGYDKAAGGGNTCIWAHAQLSFNWSFQGFLFKRYAASSELENTSGSTIATIGTFCHEYGHVIGALDFYDTNYSTWGEYQGTGYWDLQASGSHQDGGRKPATPNPRSKIFNYGWATSIELSTPQRCTIPVARIYDNAYFRINTQDPNQYFIIENKKQEGFDSGVPGKNLLIYKCTEDYEANHYNPTQATYPQNMTSWQRFYPVAANAKVVVPEPGTNKQPQYGSINSSTCTWPQTNQKAFTDSSIPGMVTWDGNGVGKPITNIIAYDDFVTFDFMGGGDKLNFHVFLPAYYGCVITKQPGSVSPVNAGGSFAFKVELLPSHNKSIIKVTANNKVLTPASGNIYTISNIQADQIVRIEDLKFNTFSISATASANGIITPEGDVPVNQGGIKKFEIYPNNGYSIDKVFVDGNNKGNINSYTFMNVNEPHAINATFKKGDLYTINTSKDNLSFETYTGIPSDSIDVIVSSPDIISSYVSISVDAPERFQVSSGNGKWVKGFSITQNKLPYKLYVRFAPIGPLANVGTFEEVLTFKSTDAYAEIKLSGKALLGINDNINENAIAIYPNPTNGKLLIESKDIIPLFVEVFDTYGRSVSSRSLNISTSLQELDISNLSAGIYLIDIHTDKGIIHKKVVKE